jgi:DNA-nicking Smr family endonuclease
MARRSRKDASFNSPFRNLKLPESAAPAPKAAAAKTSRAASTAAKTHDEGGGTVDDGDLFLQAMSGVTAVKKHEAARVEPAKTLERRGPDDEAMALMEFESFARGDSPFSLTDTEEFQYGLAPGVTHELLASLKRGDFAFRQHLDLHGLSRDEAHAALGDFVVLARRNNERCVLVITGRGKSSPDGVSVIKEALPRWLSRAPIRAHVLAFCTAQSVHGGPGAFYVLLRRQGQRPFGVEA